MIHIDVPTTVRVNDVARVNLNLCIVSEVEKAKPVMVQDDDKEGTFKQIGEADTVSFWFIGGTSLMYRVGIEITQADFDRISSVIKSIEFKSKSERDTGNNKANKTA